MKCVNAYLQMGNTSSSEAIARSTAYFNANIVSNCTKNENVNQKTNCVMTVNHCNKFHGTCANTASLSYTCDLHQALDASISACTQTIADAKSAPLAPISSEHARSLSESLINFRSEMESTCEGVDNVSQFTKAIIECTDSIDVDIAFYNNLDVKTQCVQSQTEKAVLAASATSESSV